MVLAVVKQTGTNKSSHYKTTLASSSFFKITIILRIFNVSEEVHRLSVTCYTALAF